MVLVDIDGDGRLDPAIGSYGSSRLITFLTATDGSLGRRSHYSVGGNPIAVAGADFNEDGRMDLATANHVGNSVTVLLGDRTEELLESSSAAGLRLGFGRGNVTDGSDIDYWSFSAKSGDRVNVAIEIPGNPGASSLYVRLDYPDGTYFTDFGAAYTGYGQSAPVVITSPGTYRVRVSFNYGYTGEYRLRVAVTAAGTQIESEDNDWITRANGLEFADSGHSRNATVAGAIGVWESADFFSLGNLSTGTTIQLGQRQPASSGFAPVLRVFNSAGAAVATGVVGSPRLDWTIPTNDAYYASLAYAVGPGVQHPGGAGISLSFDGADDYLEVPIDVPESAMTVSLWFKTTSPNVGLFSVVGPGHDRHIFLSGGNLAARIYSSDTIVSSGLNLADGKWHQAVLTYGPDISGTGLYVDGALVASSSKSNSDFTSQTGIRIGYAEDAPQRWFYGSMDDVRIWDRAFSAADVLAGVGTPLTGSEPGLLGWWKLSDGAGGVALDSSPGGRHATLVNGPLWAAGGTDASVTRGLQANYLLDIRMEDNSGPTIKSVTLPAEGAITSLVSPWFTVGFSEDMQAATVNSASTYDLRGAGFDRTFDTADDVAYTVVPQGYTTGLTSGFTVPDGPLQPDAYRFTIKTSLMDRFGNALAAPYMRRFSVENVERFALEGRTNGSHATSTTISAAPGPQGSGSFGYQGTLATGSTPYHIVRADLNKDGHQDVVVANYGSSSVTIYLGRGDGSFSAAPTLSCGGNAMHLAVGDYDKDGAVDIAAANWASSDVWVFPGNGDGTFQTAARYPVGTNPNGVESADLNGDGWLDLVSADRSSRSISVLLNQGDGTFGPRTPFTSGNGASRLALADLNGDGKLDAATSDYYDSTYSVLLGNGDGTFQAAEIKSLGGSPYDVQAADFNRDGKLDLVFALIAEGRVTVLLGNGDGTFGPRVDFGSGGSQPHYVEVADLNGDGFADLLASNYASSRVGVLYGNGDATFMPVLSFPSGGNVLCTASGDFNEDGRSDFVSMNYGSGDLYVFTGDVAQPLPQDGIAGVKIAGGRGQLFDGSDLDYFSFSGNAGDTILLAVDIPGNPGASSLYYRIEYPDGSSLYEFASAYTGAGQSPPITLPITSTYWVRVSFNYGYQGEYRFRVYSVRPPVGLESEENGSIGQANPLSFTATGETRSASAVGYIRYDGDLDYFNLGTITNGSTVFLSARSTSGSPLAPIVSLYDASNGYLVEAGTGRPFDGVSEVRFNRTGGCYAVVRGPDGTAGLGSSYQLDVQVVPTGSVSFPNLVVTEVTPPSGLGIRSGQPINFSYRVENAGTVGTGGSGWIDRILLTANQIVGDADDIQIGVVQRNEGLASGTGYAAESSAVIPEGIAGTFYLAVQTDFGDAVNELVLEGDNTTFSENTFTVTRPPYADLKIEGLTVTGPDASGTYSIGWTTANRGTASASGGFVERLLVRNQTAGVILVNTDRPVAGDLAPNATLAGSANVTTTTPGIYQVVVLTDAQNRIFEYDVNGHVSAEQNSAEAGFEITQLFTILLRSSPSEGGSVAGGGTFPLGSTVTVSATADAGVLPYRFQNWTEGGVFQSGQASYAFTVTRDRTLTANFALPVYQISVANEPASGGFVTGPGAYVHGAAVTLQAHAGAGYLFTNWTESGTVVGTAPQLAFQAAGTRSLVAHYMEANTFHDVTLVTEPSGIATLAGAGRYLNGQSLQVIAPASVTNPPSIYTFKHLRQNNTVVSSQPSYRKTFTTADTTNVTFTAVYDTRSIAPVIVNAIGGVSNAALARIVSQELVPISTNYQVLVQFDRGMDPAVTPQFVISNLTAGAAQAVVPPGGTWSRTLAPNDTFVCPQVVFSAAMDGRHEVWVSAAADPSGVPVEPVRVVSFVMDGIAPQHPALALAEFNNSTARVAWDAYAAAADLDGFRVFLQPAPFSNVTGLAPLTRVDASARSYVFSGLELEKDYYAAMVAVDRAGNFNPAATALTVRLASTLPPPVALQVTPSGADAAHLDWSGYDTSALVGFAGFRLYFEEHPFSSVAGLPVRGTFGPGQRIADLSGFVRSLRYSIAIVGFNRNGEFNPNVTAATWSDPYGGNISVDTVMGGPGQVIELFNPATVVNGATLTVRAGTTLRVAPEIGLRVQQGRIHVEGTALDPVVFTSYFENDLGDTPSPGDWSGITLEPGASGSVLRHAVVRYGRGLTVNGASITLDAFTATRNQGAGLTASQGAVLRTTEALLTFNDIGARQTDNARLTIEGSVFKNNGMHARGDGTETLAATGNWWGTPNEAEIAPLVAGAVTRSQPLVSEPILTPAIGIAGGESTVGRRDIVLRLASRTAEDMRVSEDSAYRGTFFGTFTKTLPFTLSEGAGQKMVYAQFRSVTGHTNTPVALALTYITAGPVIESFSLAEGQTISRPIQVTAQATALLGMQAIEFHWDGSLVLSQPGSTLTTLFDTRLQNDGIHRVKVLARDQSGNIATLERNVVIQVTPPPAPVITMPAADGTVTTPSLTVAGTAEPHLSVRLSRNGLTAGNAVASAAGQVTFSNVTLTEGVNELVIVASDGSGTTRSAPREILLDSGAPAALVLQTPVYRPGQGLEVGWHFAPEGERPLRFRVLWHSTSFSDPAQASGQSAIIDRMSTTLQGLPNGRYFFGVVGYDGAGNACAVSNVIPFTLDTTAPGFQVAYDKASPVGVGSVAITLTADEVLGAVPGLVVRAADGNPISVFLTPDGNNGYTGVFTVTPGMPSGPARVVVSARDVSGNESSGEPAGPELVLDTTPATGGIVTVPAGPVQCMEPAEVAVTLTLTEAPKPGTKPTLRFAPPTGDPVEIALAGAALHWTGILTLQPGMGSGFGNFQLAVLDAVDNSGSILTAGATLEIYHTLVPSAPAEPIGLAARSLPGGRVQLTWERVGNAESYRLYREPGTQGAPGVMVSDNITSLVLIDTPEQDGTYRYAVSAERRGAESTHARVVVAASDRTPPEAPADLQAVLAAAGVRITWRQPAGDAPREFRLYRNDMLIRTMTGVAPVFDSPPRGIANYVVAAVDEIGNESRSAPATLELLVGAVSDLTVLVNSGQAPAISWISSDPTATGFNVYRNGAKLNAVPLAETSFTDAGTAGFAVLQYAVRAVNAEGQESPARAVDVYRVSLALSPNPTAAGNDAPVTRYFDLMRVGVTHAGSEGALPLREIQVRRVAGATELSLTQPIGQGLAPGATLTREVVFPSAQTQQAQSFRMRAVQETDLGGSTVIYQGIFDVPGAVSPSLMAEIVANDQPLAGGLASFDVRLHNRGYAEMDVVLTRNNGQNPGDVYVSVRDGSGAEVSRAYFNGGVPGMSVLPDGTGFIRIRPGASARVTVTRVLVPEALASAPSVAFEGGTDKIYWHLGGAGQMDSGPVLGTMNTSLRQTDYYGTLETDRRSYADDMPIVLTGRAINRATGQPVPNAALRIGFTMRGFTWYRAVSTDESGSYRHVYTPASGISGTFTFWSAHPEVFDLLNQAEATLHRMYSNPSYGDIRMSKNDHLDFGVTLINPGDLTLENVTTSVRVFQVSGGVETPISTVQGTNLTEGVITLGPHESRGITLRLNAAIDAPDSCVAEFILASAEGAHASFRGAISLLPAVPVLTVAEPASGYVEVSLDRGALVSRNVTIVNNGLREMQGVEVVPPPNVRWMQVNLPQSADGRLRLPDMAVGDSQTFSVVFTPPADVAMDNYHDVITLKGSNTTQEFPVHLYALVTSAQRGSVQFFVDNILGQIVPNATVRLRNTLLQTELPPVLTDERGLVTIDSLQEGRWSWQVNAPGHSSSVGTVEIVPDQTQHVTTRLSKSLVTVTFRVEPVPYTDRYEIRIEQTFETRIPAPVLVLDPVNVHYDNVHTGFDTNFVVTGRNQGLIEMQDVEIRPASAGGGQLIPLITYFPVLRPQETIEIPYRTVYLGPDDGVTVETQCGSGGFVGISRDVIAMQSVVSAQYRLVTDSSMVTTAQGVWVSLAIYRTITAVVRPIEFFSSMASCFAQQVSGGNYGGGGSFGGGGGGGGGYSGPTPHTFADFTFTGPECFAAGTLVTMSDGTRKAIEDIRVNDVVRSGSRSGENSAVTEVYTKTAAKARALSFQPLMGAAREEELLTTDEHLFWVDGRGWVEARNLKAGEWLITESGSRAELKSNETRAGPIRFHTLRAHEHHAFYANGILVHDLCGRWENQASRPQMAGQEVRP
jgi:hypothetical protein